MRNGRRACVGMTYKGQVDGKVGWKVVQSVSWIPDTPPSPDPNRIVVPRAPNWAYALQRLLHRNVSDHRVRFGWFSPRQSFWNVLLVEAKAGREYQRCLILRNQGVDHIQKPGDSIGALGTDGHEGRLHIRRDTHGILDVQALGTDRQCRGERGVIVVSELTASVVAATRLFDPPSTLCTAKDAPPSMSGRNCSRNFWVWREKN